MTRSRSRRGGGGGLAAADSIRPDPWKNRARVVRGVGWDAVGGRCFVEEGEGGRRWWRHTIGIAACWRLFNLEQGSAGR